MATNKVLTIDITNESVTIIEATPSLKKTTMIHNAIIFETPAGSYEDGYIKNKESLARAIREQLDSHGVSNKNAIFILTSTKIVNREVTIPYVKENKIKGIINANAAEYFPVNIEDYVVSHTLLETMETEGKQQRVMVVAAPLNMVKAYYDLAAMCGLKVESLDYIGNSMLQLIKTQTASNATTMVIQLGSESTVLNIVKGDTLLLQRTVPYGTDAVVNAVMENRNVDAATAMTLLQNERLITVDFEDNDATEAFRYLMNNISRVIDYFASKHPDKPIDDVYLTGDGALIRGLDGLFKIQLNLTTKIMDSLYNIKFDPTINMTLYNPVYLIAPIGAAFAPMGFVPDEYVARAKNKNTAKLFVQVAIASVVVSAGLVGWSLVAKGSAQRAKDLAQANVDSIKDIENIEAEYNNAVKKTQDLQSMYNMTLNDGEYLLDFIQAAEQKQPESVNLSSITSSDDNKVEIVGTGTNKQSIAKYFQQLQTVGCVRSAFIDNIKMDTDSETGKKSFEFHMTFGFSPVAVKE